MPGELVDIGPRPKIVASFYAPGATERFGAWRARNAEVLARVPAEAYRVEYGRAGAGLFIRVRIDEEHLPPDLEAPDELDAGDQSPPAA
ncbi:MAG: hypothetical protein H0V20_00085 [Actinobacteria bacterium]|nr:hypothetical protein [Actinomycetota bacterium]